MGFFGNFSFLKHFISQLLGGFRTPAMNHFLEPVFHLSRLGIAASLGWLVTGFVVFRCFDIWKPRPARWAERSFEGGAGVMLDDVVAGLLAAAVVGGAAIAVWT